MNVDVYFNLHKHCWSVKDRKTGLVVAHREEVLIRNATGVVQPAGRDRVRKEGRKNVHAFIRGEWVDIEETPTYLQGWASQITYNPYKNDTFVYKSGVHDGCEFTRADAVLLKGRAAFAITMRMVLI